MQRIVDEAHKVSLQAAHSPHTSKHRPARAADCSASSSSVAVCVGRSALSVQQGHAEQHPGAAQRQVAGRRQPVGSARWVTRVMIDGCCIPVLENLQQVTHTAYSENDPGS